MEINPQQLRYLLAIGRCGSFVKAAETLNISQPALSVAISRLEDVLGTRLLERGRNGARLTPEGSVLIRHAESLEMVLHSARQEVEMFGKGIAGPIAVGGTPLATVSIIPDVLARLSEEYPSLRVQVVEDVDEGLVARLMRHELDVIVSNVGLSISPDDLIDIPLFRARAVAVVRSSHPMAKRSILSIDDLVEFTCVLPPTGGALRMQIEALFTANSRPFPRNIIEAAPFSVLKAIVRRSNGVTILSDQIVRSELHDGALIAIPLKEEIAVRTFGLQVLKNRHLGPLANRFIELAKAVSPDYDMPS